MITYWAIICFDWMVLSNRNIKNDTVELVNVFGGNPMRIDNLYCESPGAKM